MERSKRRRGFPYNRHGFVCVLSVASMYTLQPGVSLFCVTTPVAFRGFGQAQNYYNQCVQNYYSFQWLTYFHLSLFLRTVPRSSLANTLADAHDHSFCRTLPHAPVFLHYRNAVTISPSSPTSTCLFLHSPHSYLARPRPLAPCVSPLL